AQKRRLRSLVGSKSQHHFFTKIRNIPHVRASFSMLGLTSSSYSFRLPFGQWGFAESRVLAKATRMAIPHEGRSHVEHLNKPTAYGDGLRGLRNTDITDAHGSIITDLLFFLFF
ncbi:hypothetical protein AAAT34_12880, partial [Hallella faecis]